MQASPIRAATLSSDGRTVLRGRADDLLLDESEVAGVEALLVRGSMTAEELGIELARRLLLAGVAVVP